MQRLLLKTGTSREQVAALFDQAGWRATEDGFTPTQVIGYQRNWVDPSGAWTASHAENLPLGCAYVFTSDGTVAAVTEMLSSAGLLLTRDEVLNASLAEGDDADALRDIGRLGLLAHGPFDKSVFAKLAALLINRYPIWQRYALYALSNTSWEPFGPVLREAIDGGAFEGDLAGSAALMLRDLEASNWNEALYREPGSSAR